jgi:hypothetical protein
MFYPIHRNNKYEYKKLIKRLEAAQMKFLRHLLGITKLDKEKNHCLRKKQYDRA